MPTQATRGASKLNPASLEEPKPQRVEASFAATPHTQPRPGESIAGSAGALKEGKDPGREDLVHAEVTLNKFASEEDPKTMTNGEDNEA